MNRYDFVIFDFDGTVVDTGEGIMKSLLYCLDYYGRERPDEETLRKFIGPPLFQSFEKLYHVPVDLIPDYIDKYRERYRTIGIFESRIYPGMEELLKRLRKAGVKTGIASSKPVKLIYDVMDHIGITGLFDVVYGTQFDDSNHRSKTDLINGALEELGCRDKSRALMVGDRKFDIDAAACAGVDCAAVLYGYGSRGEFEEHRARYILSSAEEIGGLALGEE